MINKQSLLDLVARAERGALLPGEATILRDAVSLLDDLASTLDKIMNGYGSSSILNGYDLETTQQLKIIEQGDDHHGGNRP
jgi:hypothetical protein